MAYKWDRKSLVLFLMAVGYFLCYLDRMVISTAIPYIGMEFNLREFNNEVQHLGQQEGACYSKWLWENNTGI